MNRYVEMDASIIAGLSHSLGKFVAANKVVSVAIVVSAAIIVLVARSVASFASAENSKNSHSTSAIKAATIVAAVPAPVRVDPMLEACTTHVAKVTAKAKALLAKGDAGASFGVLHECYKYLKAPNDIALYQSATVAATKKTKLANEKAERQAKAQKKSEGVSIGMSQQDALDSSWGRPTKVNRTTTGKTVSEQWVYEGSGYLYFTDGVLTAYQN